MAQSSPKSRKLSVTIVLALFILSAFVISGFTIAGVDHQDYRLPLNEGPVSPQAGGEGDDQEPTGGGAQEPAEPVNVIKNGNFEEPFEQFESVAPEWEPYSNGQAHFGWYEETWPEAVRTGERAQLMEIFEVEPNVQSRMIAIHQTVDVAVNSTYDLEFYAIMRSQVQPDDRNKNEFEMHWGVDFSGEGNYENVEEWVFIPLEEQFRLGSNGEYPDDLPLFYEIVTGTIQTEDSAKITLFIRGLKKFSTGAEVNFDIDDVSLIGPPPGPVVIITPEAPQASEESETPTEDDAAIPDTGAVLPENVSGGALALGGFVLVALGVGAVTGVLQNRKKF